MKKMILFTLILSINCSASGVEGSGQPISYTSQPSFIDIVCNISAKHGYRLNMCNPLTHPDGGGGDGGYGGDYGNGSGLDSGSHETGN